MFKLFEHIVYSIIACVMFAACADRAEMTDNTGHLPAGSLINLSFAVVVPDAVDGERSRAVVTIPDDNNYFEREANKYEKLHTLRVIILRPSANGTKVVEHNRLVTFSDDGAILSDVLDFPVRGGETKTVYLIANEAAVDYDFSGISKGSVYSSGTFENLTVSPKGDNGVLLYNNSENIAGKTYIPMGEVYDFYVPNPKEDNDKFSAGTLFVTRAAVKFSFSITARDGEDLCLKSILFNGLADREYFLPHNTVYNPAKGNPGTQKPGTETTGRFITSYSIPSDVNHHPFTFSFDKPIPLSAEPKELLPVFYFCESKLHAAPSSDGSSAKSPYSIGITLTEADGKNELLLESVPLPNLPILPRNTHVKVNISLTKANANCVVDIRPYSEVILEPDFGL